MPASVLSVNGGSVRPVPWGQLKRSAIHKQPLEGPVRVERLGLVPDTQADAKHHGGVDKAVYAYAREDLDWWQAELDRDLAPAMFGENLTTVGVEVTGAMIGERWRIGEVLLEVSSPRIPCSVFAGWMDEQRWVRRFTEAARPGAYLRVLEEGELAAGDAIEVVHRPRPGVTIGESFLARTGRSRERSPG